MPTSCRPGRPTPRTRILGAAVATVALIAGAATVAWSHDFWLVPSAFSGAPGSELVVRGQTSSLFPTSESAVTTDRVADAVLVGPSVRTMLRGLSIQGRSLVLRQRAPERGQHIVAVRLAARSVRESPASFRRYLELEGAPEALARYEREGRMPTDSITRRYAKYAKTIVEVGSGGARTFDRAVDHPAEFIPLSDPAALRAGDTLRVRLQFRGAPVAGAHVHAGTATPGARMLEDTAAARRAARNDVSLTTDAEGIAALVIDRAGVWNVRAIHIVPADAGSGADWDVHWATVVFEVRPGARPAPSRSSADSAAAVGAVLAYHRALDTGDSTGALALLRDDAIVLESGGVETRAEYRSHHLQSDIAFARGVPARRTIRQVRVQGNAAWVSSTSVTEGTFNGRAVNSTGAELMVLARDADGRWRIAAIHWSSRARRTP